jgi:hypothetical protein
VLVRQATEPAPGHDNEDHIVVGDGFVVVLDGVTEPPRADTGCVHSPRWVVETLGDALAVRLAARPAVRLPSLLGDAIVDLREAHGGACDLGNPDSPSTTVAILRENTGSLDYLVLCDSTVVIGYGGNALAITDDRTARLPAYDRATVAGLRNAGGFWVASTVPEAADHALTGSVTRVAGLRAMACTDGVSRLVEWFGHTWIEVLDSAYRDGPGAVISAVRAEESAEPVEPVAWPRRRKRHDDAAIAICEFS